MTFFTWLEQSGFSTWIKESTSIWPYDLLCLSSHSIGMAILVGVSSAVALRIIGFAPQLPLAPMAGFFPVMYAGFWINVLSGAGLFIAYPVKAVTNPIFYVKMAGVVLAVLCIRRIRREVFVDPVRVEIRRGAANPKMLAGGLLFIWLGTITAGRLMAYHDVGSVERQVVLAVLIVTSVMALAWYAASRLKGQSLELVDDTREAPVPAAGRRPQP
jgi:hypothetical protein